jgi:hypothetical protein
MIKNINLEFYQFILLIIMIFFTVYVWIKSIIKCSDKNNLNYEKIYNENKKLKKYILYIQKYLNTNYNTGYLNNNLNTANYNTNLNNLNTANYNTGYLNSNLKTSKYNTDKYNIDKYNTDKYNTDKYNTEYLNTTNYNYNDKIIY